MKIFSTDHKTVGIQYLIAALIFFAIGGAMAMILRWQLAWSGLLPETYNSVFTMHGTVMIFLVVIPMLVGGFGSYLLPLQIGARQSAYPFLGGLSFWTYLLAATISLMGFFLPGGAAGSSWTAYPPLSAITYNGAGFVAAEPLPLALSILQVRGGTWSLLPILLMLATCLPFAAYIATQAFPTNRRFLKFIAWLISAVASIGLLRVIQVVAFDGQACWFLGILLFGCTSIMLAVNHIVTVLTLRCAGMTMFRLPLTVWNMLITSVLMLLASPALVALLIMSLLDHHRLTSFFLPGGWTVSGQLQRNAGGGSVLLHPHLFWFYSHPAVYIMILPAMGFVSDILAVFARKPVFGYRAMVYASGTIAFLGFIVWGHHMFQSGMSPALGTAFMLSTMLIAVPSGVKVFNWLGTIFRGRITLTVPMLNALAFVSLFVTGGLSGIILASTPVNTHLHNTYFVVAHVHYVLFGGSIFGIFAAVYYWYPRMVGRMMNPILGYIHFGLTFIAFNCTFLAMHWLGLQGVPRRMYDFTPYRSFLPFQPLNVFITCSAFALFAGQLPFVLNFIGSAWFGRRAPANPWRATTLEWSENTSPVVQRGAYEFSPPEQAEDFIPQDAPASGSGRDILALTSTP